MPFFLNRNVHPEGEDLVEYIAKKYGPEAGRRFNSPDNPLNAAGRKVGIDFNPARRVIPTLLCHRAMEWCNEKTPEKSDEFMEALFKAYFEQAADVSKTDSLLACAEAVGLDVGALRAVLDKPEEFLAAVDAKASHATRNLRVSGVPYFIIEGPGTDRPIAFSGAQVLHWLFKTTRMLITTTNRLLLQLS